jgi:hypothetical protein
MRYTRQTILGAAVTMAIGGFAAPVHAQSPWSALVGTCASTDNNFFSGTPSVNLPVARFITPGGSLTFNRFHQGYIAVLCTVDNPRDNVTQPWNRLHVTYRDPDGLRTIDGYGLDYQVYVELVRMSKTSGALFQVARFDSNLQCQQTPTTSCYGDNAVKRFAVTFNHTFDFNNYAYAVYARLYRGNVSFLPQVYQVRMQAAPLTTAEESEEVPDPR